MATPYLLLLPAVVMYAIFTVYPIFRQFEISFFNWHIFPGASNPFVGFSNFTQIFHDPVVRTAAFNSFLFIVITVPVQMAIGLFAAAFLTDRLPGGMFWRAAVYIPVVTSWVVVSYIFAYIFSSAGRDHERRRRLFRRPHRDIAWTAQTWTGNVVIWIISIWKGVGWSFIIFLAALDGVPRQLLESARIDGATEPRVWRHVVLPSIRPAFIFVLVLLVIGAAQVFTQIYLVTLGGPYNSTQALMTYMYHAGVQGLRVRLRGGHGVFARRGPFRFQRGRDPHPAPRRVRRPSTWPSPTGSAAPAAARSTAAKTISSQPGLFGIRRMNKTRLAIGIILALVSLFPLLYMFSLSFQPNGGILGSTALIPTHPTSSNYVQAWTENSFGHYFFNSLFVAIATVVITVTFAVPGRLRLRPLRVPVERVHLLRLPGRAWPCPTCSS